jgi:hypothetical protein
MLKNHLNLLFKEKMMDVVLHRKMQALEDEVRELSNRVAEMQEVEWDTIARIQSRAEAADELTWSEVYGIQSYQDNEIIEALRALYMAGTWSTEHLTTEEQTALWQRVKDLTGWTTKDPSAGR